MESLIKTICNTLKLAARIILLTMIGIFTLGSLASFFVDGGEASGIVGAIVALGTGIIYFRIYVRSVKDKAVKKKDGEEETDDKQTVKGGFVANEMNGKNPIFTPDRKFFFCECGAKVSVDAKSCPSCGDPGAKAKAQKRAFQALPVWQQTIRHLITLGVIGLIVFGIAKCVSSVSEPADRGPTRPRDCLTTGFGDNLKPVSTIRNFFQGYLKDPDSYESISAQVITDADPRGWVVVNQYRAKNSFGGFVINEVKVLVSVECEPLAIISSE